MIINRATFWVFAVNIVAVAAVAYTWAEWEAHHSAYNWLMSTVQIRRQAMLVRIDCLEAESSERGFVLTGHPDYAAAYDHAVRTARERTDSLLRLTSHKPTQHQRVQELRAASESMFASTDKIMGLVRGGEWDGAVEVVRSGEVKARSRNVADLSREVISEEDRILDARRERVETLYSHSIVATIITAAALAGAMVTLFRRWPRRHHPRDKDPCPASVVPLPP